MTTVKRQTLGFDGREIYFRYAGNGPPVVLCHESPRSSAALLPLMERLAPHFTVIGFDTPGFGGSDPLRMDHPSSADYADALAMAMTGLGLKRTPVYGTHTGACIAMSLAVRHPDQVSVVILDGYPIFTTAEKEELLRDYLPTFRPVWDGTHVAWLWARVRDQFTFFPWYATSQSSRLPRDPPGLEFHQLIVEDFLRAGDDYRPAYASAFRFEAIKPLVASAVPVAIMAREDDLLFPHLERLPDDLPSNVSVHRLSADRDVWGDAIGRLMADHPGQGAFAHEAFPASLERPLQRGFVEVGDGLAHFRRAGQGMGRPLVLLHRTPGWSAEFNDQIIRLGHTRHAIAIDLPGNGESDCCADMSLEGLLNWLEETLAKLDINACDLAGEHTGAAIAGAFAARGSIDIGRLVMAQAPENNIEPVCPDMIPRWDGGHLMAAWYWARDGLLYRNWNARRARASWDLETDSPILSLHARFVGAVLGAKGNAALCTAALSAPPGLHLDTAARHGTEIDNTDRPLAAYPLDGSW
ncbi:MAG: alpha/beta fold hydrolase [Rhodospirillaceae bacterium]|nr:alpha/beta fold hydrolase [Rhodospirillaceae bacterium]